MAMIGQGMAAAPCSSQSTKDRAVIGSIIEMEHKRIEAGVHKDPAAVAAMTYDGYAQIDFDGRLLGQTSTMHRIRGSGMQLKSNSIDGLVVRICGDTAIVTGNAHPRGTFDGKPFAPEIRYSRIYLLRDGEWRVIFFQQTRVVAGK